MGANDVLREVKHSARGRIDRVGAKHVGVTAGVGVGGSVTGFTVFSLLVENGVISPDLGPQTTAIIVLGLGWLLSVATHLFVKLTRKYPALQIQENGD